MRKQSRREFLVGTCLFAGMIAFGGASEAFAGDDTLLRPPGGQDETAFRAACLKCDRCRTACERGIIELATVSDGFLNARMPVLNLHGNYCDFCERCIRTCPTGALAPFDPATQKIGVARIDTSVCYAYQRGSCDLCRGSCPYGALEFTAANLPVVDEDVCNGCGACVVACKINVFSSYGGSSDRAIEVRKAV